MVVGSVCAALRCFALLCAALRCFALLCAARCVSRHGRLMAQAVASVRKKKPGLKKRWKSVGKACIAARHRSHPKRGTRNGAARAQKKSQARRVSFPDTILPAVSGDALEIDELVIRYRFKRRCRCLWVVKSRLHHQVLAWRVRCWRGVWATKAQRHCKNCGLRCRLLIGASWFIPFSTKLTRDALRPGSIAPAKKAAEKPA